ncbi:xanthine dehydrogenase/oxidase-like [Pecten maximus]|uniref:xanthine dehydrogenase/oxidase-like n=1 Tax=Pecten maximus TaxID=6579 RepID=UPI001458B32C|nr:xanthine dehydrogenase/oxidase-like [Pecten maximus]
MLHVDGSYKIPNYRVEGYVCRTNTPSNTAFRGFGAPEGAFIIESLIADFETTLTVPREQIRSTNLYKEGDSTHFNSILTDCNVEKCWNECMVQSNFAQKKEDIKQFNNSHVWRKRGVAIMPSKCAVLYPTKEENQGCALVNVYLDGSVLISHGGIEMGQGLHTKMIQVASRALDIPMDNVHISDTGTNITPNSVPSAASASTDLYGEAVLNACRTLRERLAPFQEKNPQISWPNLVQKAFHERVSLSATGFSRVGTNHRDFEKGEGDPYNYYSFSACCSVVEIDCLTGEHQVLSTDIVMDVGKSLNPGIDIGQIEGAFVQGYGWLTSEEIVVKADGRYNVTGPVDYKIPNVKDIPREIKVSLLKDCPNEKALYSSKAIGEPPLLLSISVYLALRDAINTARKDAGLSPVSGLDIPLTAEVIRSVCP